MTRTLYRSRSDRMIAGVCGGIANYFEIDPTVVRLLAVVLAWASSGVAVLAYIVMALVVPEEPEGSPVQGSGGTSAWQAAAQGAAPVGKDETMADDTGNEPGRPGEQTRPAVQEPPPPYAPSPGQPGRPANEAPAPERRRGGLVAGLILMGLGALFLAQQFYPGIDIGRLWPLVLVIVGLAMIFRRR